MDAVPTHESLNERELLRALRSFRKGDFSVRLPVDPTGIDGDIAETFNDVVERNQELVKEFSRLSTPVSKPVDPDQLISTVCTWLHRMRRAEERS